MSVPLRRFDASYSETLELSDGSEVTLRLVRAEDKELLVRGIARLSDQSRYLRFFTAKSAFSDRELSYLTELDQEKHFALGAVRRGADGTEEGMGVARFVVLEEGIAEPAIVVVDEMQRKGLGRELLVRLVSAARERGITTFKSEVLADNIGIRKLLQELAAESLREQVEGDVVMVWMALPPADARHGPVFRLLQLAAQGLVRVAEALRTLAESER